MVPFREFFAPVLEVFGDNKPHNSKDIKPYCIEYFELDEDDIKAKTKNGNKYQLNDRIHWAITYLYHSGLIDRTGWGKYIITSKGEEYLNGASEKDRSESLQSFFDERYRNYLSTRRK